MDFRPSFDEERQQEGCPISYISMRGHLIVRTMKKTNIHVAREGICVCLLGVNYKVKLNFKFHGKNWKQNTIEHKNIEIYIWNLHVRSIFVIDFLLKILCRVSIKSYSADNSTRLFLPHFELENYLETSKTG